MFRRKLNPHPCKQPYHQRLLQVQSPLHRLSLQTVSSWCRKGNRSLRSTGRKLPEMSWFILWKLSRSLWQGYHALLLASVDSLFHSVNLLQNHVYVTLIGSFRHVASWFLSRFWGCRRRPCGYGFSQSLIHGDGDLTNASWFFQVRDVAKCSGRASCTGPYSLFYHGYDQQWTLVQCPTSPRASSQRQASSGWYRPSTDCYKCLSFSEF